jgi:hypothetical protein
MSSACQLRAKARASSRSTAGTRSGATPPAADQDRRQAAAVDRENLRVRVGADLQDERGGEALGAS